MFLSRPATTFFALIWASSLYACGEEAPANGGAYESLQQGLQYGELGALPDFGVVTSAMINGSRTYCSGTYIGGRHVLTAAHCVTGLHGLVFSPEGYPNSVKEPVAVLSASIHPDYRSGNEPAADLAVLTIVKPLSSPGMGLTFLRPEPNERYLVIGAGVNEARQLDERSRMGIMQAGQISNDSDWVELESAPPGRTMLAHGDLGGPVLKITENGATVVPSIVAVASACSEKRPVCYGTFLHAYAAWLIQEMWKS